MPITKTTFLLKTFPNENNTKRILFDLRFFGTQIKVVKIFDKIEFADLDASWFRYISLGQGNPINADWHCSVSYKPKIFNASWQLQIQISSAVPRDQIVKIIDNRLPTLVNRG